MTCGLGEFHALKFKSPRFRWLLVFTSFTPRDIGHPRLAPSLWRGRSQRSPPQRRPRQLWARTTDV